MSALETWTEVNHETHPGLHLVQGRAAPLRGPLVAARRAARARMRRRRRRTLTVVAVVVSFLVLMFPGHAFGGTGSAGLSADELGAVGLTPGSVYVVQSGDTLHAIAQLVNPWNSSAAYRALVGELHSGVVVAGEHIIIP